MNSYKYLIIFYLDSTVPITSLSITIVMDAFEYKITDFKSAIHLVNYSDLYKHVTTVNYHTSQSIWTNCNTKKDLQHR